MERTQGLALGVVIGLIIGFILVVVFLKFANKDNKAKTEYDERQKVIRGKGYMAGFYTLVVLLAIETIWSIAGYEFPLPSYLVYFSSIIIGITVMCAYDIWNGVYWGMNNDPKRYAIVFIFAIILNLIPVFGAMRKGGIDFSDPISTLPMLNVIVLIMFVVIFAVMLIRKLFDRLCGEGE